MITAVGIILSGFLAIPLFLYTKIEILDPNVPWATFCYEVIHFKANAIAEHPRASAITFEFGRHTDTYFRNLEGHGSPNPLKIKLKKFGFGRNLYTGCPKKNQVQILRTF